MDQVRLVDISKKFGIIQALRNVTLTFPHAAVTALVGENGAGKSTLMKVLMGVVQPDVGSIYVDGKPVKIINPIVARKMGFSAVFQEPLVFPGLSVWENLFVGQFERTRAGNIDVRLMKQKAQPFLEQLGLDGSILDHHMGSLSIGYQQLVLIAQALLFQSQMIIFDEPTAILSARETDHLFRIIENLKRSGHIILYVSHRLDELSEVADHVTVLTDGQVVANYHDHEWTTQDLVIKMSGQRHYRPTTGEQSNSQHESGEVILEVEDLTIRPYLQPVSFRVRASEIIGFYGQVGAGRSELMQAIFGMRKFQSGTIRLQGQDIVPRNPREAMLHGIAYLPEDRREQGLFLSQSLVSNMMAGGLNPFRRIFGFLHIAEIDRKTQEMAEHLAIKAPGMTVPVSSLSGGGQQKVLFARWLAHQGMKVMIFDEPTRGIDVTTKQEIHDLIRVLAQQGLAVIVVSSDLPEVLALGMRIYVMREGAVAGHFMNQENVREEILKTSIGLAKATSGIEVHG